MCIAGDAKWRCYVCDPKPLAELIHNCDLIIQAIDTMQKKKNEKEVKKTQEKDKRAPVATPAAPTPPPATQPPSRKGLPSRGGKTGDVNQQSPANIRQHPEIKSPAGIPMKGTPVMSGGKMIGFRSPSSTATNRVTPTVNTSPQTPMYAEWDIKANDQNVLALIDRAAMVTESMHMLLCSLREDVYKVSKLNPRLQQVKQAKTETAMKLRRAMKAFNKSFHDLANFSRRNLGPPPTTVKQILQQSGGKPAASQGKSPGPVARPTPRIIPNKLKNTPPAKPSGSGGSVEVIELLDSDDESKGGAPQKRAKISSESTEEKKIEESNNKADTEAVDEKKDDKRPEEQNEKKKGFQFKVSLSGSGPSLKDQADDEEPGEEEPEVESKWDENEVAEKKEKDQDKEEDTTEEKHSEAMDVEEKEASKAERSEATENTSTADVGNASEVVDMEDGEKMDTAEEGSEKKDEPEDVQTAEPTTNATSSVGGTVNGHKQKNEDSDEEESMDGLPEEDKDKQRVKASDLKGRMEFDIDIGDFDKVKVVQVDGAGDSMETSSDDSNQVDTVNSVMPTTNSRTMEADSDTDSDVDPYDNLYDNLRFEPLFDVKNLVSNENSDSDDDSAADENTVTMPVLNGDVEEENKAMDLDDDAAPALEEDIAEPVVEKNHVDTTENTPDSTQHSPRRSKRMVKQKCKTDDEEEESKQTRSGKASEKKTKSSRPGRSRQDMEAQRVLHKELLDDSDDDEESANEEDEEEESEESESEEDTKVSSGDEYKPGQDRRQTKTEKKEKKSEPVQRKKGGRKKRRGRQKKGKKLMKEYQKKPTDCNMRNMYLEIIVFNFNENSISFHYQKKAIKKIL